jgi:signal transduction histidine kinase
MEQAIHQFRILKSVVLKRLASAFSGEALKEFVLVMDEYDHFLDDLVREQGKRESLLREENQLLRGLAGISETGLQAKILEQGAENEFLRRQIVEMNQRLAEAGKANDALRLEKEQLKNSVAAGERKGEEEKERFTQDLNAVLGKLQQFEKLVKEKEAELEREKERVRQRLPQQEKKLFLDAEKEIRFAATRMKDACAQVAASAQKSSDAFQRLPAASAAKKTSGLNRLNEQGASLLGDIEAGIQDSLNGAREAAELMEAYIRATEQLPAQYAEMVWPSFWDELNRKFSPLCKLQKLKCRFPREKKYPSFFTDRKILLEIGSVLLQNAVEALKPEGALDVSVSFEGDNLILSVADDGPGVALENRGKLFLPFFTTKTGHKGLGLALARRRAKSLGGSLEYAPQAGRTVFSVTIPSKKG